MQAKDNPGAAIVAAGRRLCTELARLSAPAGVAATYNPLEYAREPWEEYVARFVTGPRRVVFLGMNPGPWGMAQTGVPFGEVAAVRDWMGITGTVGKPPREHPKRPITGFACQRSEVSGRRLWGLMADRYGTAEAFFAEHIALNYCPLVFMGDSGRNVTPDKLYATYREPLFEACDAMLEQSLSAVQPRFAVGVGAFAEVCLRRVTERLEKNARPTTLRILHPSPASPAANRGWAEPATESLVAAGVWR